jgi:hypothetical protein
MSKAIFLVIAIFTAGSAAAQQPRPDPSDPKARVPAVEHRSAFESYRRYAQPEVSGWREMNDEAGRVGGHVGMHRQGTAKPGAKPPAAAPSAQGGHEGHK